MEYYLTIKRKEGLIHATTWMNLETIVLSENKQAAEYHVLYDSIYSKCPE